MSNQLPVAFKELMVTREENIEKLNEALQDLADHPGVVEEATELLKHADSYLRNLGALTLSHSPVKLPDSAVEDLYFNMGDPLPDARYCAAIALANTGEHTRRVQEVLEAAREHEEFGYYARVLLEGFGYDLDEEDT